MTVLDYFIYSVNNKLLHKLNWYYTFFTINSDNFNNNPYIRYDSKYEVLVNNEWVVLDNVITTPILSMLLPITINKDIISNIDGVTDTTIGRFIINKILLEYSFDNKIPYINKQIKLSDIEKIVGNLLKNDIITVDEYLKFSNSAIFVHNFSRITNVSATPKNILPPPNLNKYKSDLKKEFDSKYGIGWVNNRVKIVEFQDKLKEYDSAWLAGDPSDGKLIAGKIKNNARAKMFLQFGSESGFDNKSGKFEYVSNSLLDGYPEDKQQLTAMFNSSRVGSYGRGKETQKGGAVAKDMLRATSSTTIIDGDCNTTIGKKVYVTKQLSDKLVGRYIIVNGKSKVIDDPVKLIGSYVILRSPMYCNAKGNSFCSVCVGDNLSNYKTGIPLIVTDISNIILTTSLKGMHDTQVYTMKYDIIEAIH